MTKATFIKALTGERNENLKTILSELIESSEVIENIDGKISMFTKLWTQDSMNKAFGLANWDQYENCNALITHDLNTFEVWDLGGLISKLRLE